MENNRAIVLLSDLRKWQTPGLQHIMEAIETTKPNPESAIEQLKKKKAQGNADETSSRPDPDAPGVS